MGDKNTAPLFIDRIDRAIYKSGQNDKFIQAIMHHLYVAQNSFSNKEGKFNCRQDFMNSLLAVVFLKNPDIFPAVRYASQVDENFEWPISLYPVEAFAKEKLLDIRKKDFFECLKVADVLDCRVDGVLPTEYRLQVMHKLRSTRLLDDLNILVALPRIKFENNFLNKDLVPRELIRVAVSHVEKKNIKVTLDESTILIAKNIKLGRLSETSLPQYVLDPTEYSDCATLTDFLNLQPQFRNPLLVHCVLKSFGYNENKVSSYYSGLNYMTHSGELSGQVLMKEARNNELNSYLNTAVDEFKAGNLTNALDVIQSALEIDDNCVKIYEIRGAIYTAIKKKNALCKKALHDFENAYNLDNSSLISRKQMSRSQYMTAKKFLKASNYEKAVIAAQNALMLDEDNSKVSPFLDYLKKKHPEAFRNMHEEDELNPENMRNVSSSCPPSETIIKSEPMEH